MSTTVTYKGNTLTTVSNATKTLKTAGKYMEGDVQLTDITSTAKTYTVSLGTMLNAVGSAYIQDSQGEKYYYSNTSFTAQEGDQLHVYVAGTPTVMGYIYYNNILIASGTYGVDYNFNMPNYNIDVSVSGDDTSGKAIHISTPMLTINKNGYHNVENYGFVDVQAASTYTATLITTVGNKNENYVSYTDASGFTTKYYSVGSTFTFSAGDTATFVGTFGDSCERYLNGELISTDTNYVYTLPACNIEIQLQNYSSPTSQYTLQKIITSDGIDALTITQNGTYTASGDIKGYSPITVNVSGGTSNLQNKTVTPTESTQSITADSGYTGLGTVTVNAISTTYVGSGITRRSSSNLTASGATVSVPAGYYSAAASKTIASGSATAPSSISGTSASISTGTNTITLTKTVSVTPSVTAGYISSGSAGNSNVSLTASVTTVGTQTITPGTSASTFQPNTYITGTVTIAGDTDLTAANIKTGIQIFGVTGTYTSDATAAASDIVSSKTAYVNGSKLTGSLVVQHYYTGSSAPSASVGSNGDIYLQA